MYLKFQLHQIGNLKELFDLISPEEVDNLAGKKRQSKTPSLNFAGFDTKDVDNLIDELIAEEKEEKSEPNDNNNNNNINNHKFDEDEFDDDRSDSEVP